MLPWEDLSLFTFHPIPETLGPILVYEDKQVLMVKLREFLVDCFPGFRVRDFTVRADDF